MRCFQPGPAEFVLVEASQEYSIPAGLAQERNSSSMRLNFFLPVNVEMWLAWAFGPFWRKGFPEVYNERWSTYKSRRFFKRHCNFSDAAKMVKNEAAEMRSGAKPDSTY